MPQAGVRLYGTRFCPYCIAARKLLSKEAIAFTDILLDGDLELGNKVMQKSGRHTVPQIWFGEHHVGGYDDLLKQARMGQLHKLLDRCSG